MSRWNGARGLARSGGANHPCPEEAPMPGQFVMSSAGDSGAAVRVLSAGLGDDLATVPRLPEFLAGVPDHRRAQGRRRRLTSILGLAYAAGAARAKSLVAIAEWAAAAPQTPLDCPGGRPAPRGGARGARGGAGEAWAHWMGRGRPPGTWAARAPTTFSPRSRTTSPGCSTPWTPCPGPASRSSM